MIADKYMELWIVIIGTTLGILITKVSVVLAGNCVYYKATDSFLFVNW